ncbi:protein transport protein bos1, partial [Irineochytrium annulatum]
MWSILHVTIPLQRSRSPPALASARAPKIMSAAILYNNATSVINTLRADLARLDPSLSNDLTSDAPTTIPAPAAASGASGAIAANVNAQLQTLKKLSDDLSDLAKREITTVKREKALARAAAVKEDLRQLREHYDRWKARDAARVADLQRSQLLGTTGVTQRHTNHADGGGGPLTEKSTILMMDGLLKENEVLTSSGERLDEFINIGRTALQELYEQRSMLK